MEIATFIELDQDKVLADGRTIRLEAVAGYPRRFFIRVSKPPTGAHTVQHRKKRPRGKRT